MLQTYEGYLEKGRFYPTQPMADIQGRFRVIVTIVEKAKSERPHSWAEFDRIVASMDENEKPRLEDFPRCKIGRGLIDFDEV